MHQTRNEMPKTWPIARKGTKYLTVASHSKNKGIPLVFVLRDMLGLVKTNKESRYFVMNKNIKVNNKIRTNEKFPLQIFDSICLEKLNKYYVLVIKDKKLSLKEVSEKEAEKKTVKVIGKKVIGKDKIQVNLGDGQNFLTKEKMNVGDSVVVNNKSNKIEKVLPLKIGAEVEVIGGKHLGQRGKITEMQQLDRGKMFILKLNKQEVKLPQDLLLVVD